MNDFIIIHYLNRKCRVYEDVIRFSDFSSMYQGIFILYFQITKQFAILLGKCFCISSIHPWATLSTHLFQMFSFLHFICFVDFSGFILQIKFFTKPEMKPVQYQVSSVVITWSQLLNKVREHPQNSRKRMFQTFFTQFFRGGDLLSTLNCILNTFNSLRT